MNQETCTVLSLLCDEPFDPQDPARFHFLQKNRLCMRDYKQYKTKNPKEETG